MEEDNKKSMQDTSEVSESEKVSESVEETAMQSQSSDILESENDCESQAVTGDVAVDNTNEEDKNEAGSSELSEKPDEEQETPPQEEVPVETSKMKIYSLFKKGGKKMAYTIVGVIAAAGCLIGAICYTNVQKAKPEARLEQAVNLVKDGNFDGAAEYASKDGYFSMTDMLGKDATETQRKKIADLMYDDLDFKISKVSVNKKGTEAIVTAKVKNYNVYAAALDVQISPKEMEGKTAAETRTLLVKKAEKSMTKYKNDKKNKKIENTVHFNMIKKDGKWVVDVSDAENRMSILSLLGIQVDTFQSGAGPTKTPNKKQQTKKKETTTQNKEKDSKKEVSTKASTK